MNSNPQLPPIPLNLAPETDFKIAREFFASAGFDQSHLCELMKMGDMSDLGNVHWDKLDRTKFSPALWACAEVFLRGERLSEADLQRVWNESVLNSFRSLGLVCNSRKAPNELLCPVWLYPVEGSLIVSDRPNELETELRSAAEDVVFPGIYLGTLRFLRLLPDAHGAEALDLCGGSGIGALLLARQASKSATADVTARSAFFAEFNGRLNGVPIESLCGDLYAPTRGRQFDVITAHPPFVPATGKTMIYRDAGATGEDVTRGVIANLPDHLRPGGTCMVLCVACDTFEAPLEKRVWDWLGEKRNEFDVLYGFEKALTVEGVVAAMTKRGQNVPPEEARNLMERLRSAGTRQFVYGALFIRRLSTPTAPPPLRFGMGPLATAAEFERLFAWRRWSSRQNLNGSVAELKPKLRKGVELNVRHLTVDDELVPVEFVFSIENELRAAFRPDTWVVPLLAEFNGKRSIREVFSNFQTRGELPEGFDLNAFGGLIKRMIEKGFFEVDPG
ncbi:MAG TPA: methyltransferase [Verrucomicrobiae bacterium]|jgi:hypothetical protein|nr:methyltransferase [Verrucomicrobiae bacterium]